MENIGNLLSSLKLSIPKKSRQSTKHQIRGCEIAKKLGSKDYAIFIKLYKLHPDRCETAMSWVSDYPNAQNKTKLFLWKIKQLNQKK